MLSLDAAKIHQNVQDWPNFAVFNLNIPEVEWNIILRLSLDAVNQPAPVILENSKNLKITKMFKMDQILEHLS